MPIIEYDTYKQKLIALEPELNKLAAALDLEGAKKEVAELEAKGYALNTLADHVVVQINDTHPSRGIP